MSRRALNETRNETIEWLAAARHALEAEAQAITAAAERLDGNVSKAVGLILVHPGKVVVSGIGKSGHVAQKIAATLCSTGTTAVFLHAAEAVHGDLGVYSPGDPTVLISKSGSTAELVRLVPILRQFQSPLIGIVGNPISPLAHEVDVLLDARVAREADPLDLVPTCSTTVAMALGDALAAALMVARRFTEHDFARYHPGGQLGRNVLLCVSDVMHRADSIASVRATDSLRQVVMDMTRHPLGAACVLDEECRLVGLITDGDLRRALAAYEDIRPLCAGDIMTHCPITVSPQTSLREALHLMEDRVRQISVLPVVSSTDGTCFGLLRIHDVYQPDIT